MAGAIEPMGPLTNESPESAKTTQDSAAHSDLSASQGMHTASFDAFGIEIPVRLQGEHSGADANGATDAYQEDTCTVIVFPQGAVLRSSTNLAAGQHLVLKNQKTNQEVACRVANLRSYSADYVEIEFIHPAPGFWGIIFPSETSKSPGTRVAPNAAPSMQGPAPAPARAVTPAHKAHASLPSPAYSKEVVPRGSFPRASTSTPERPPAAPATSAAVPPKEQRVAPAATAPAARLPAVHPLSKEQPVSLHGSTSFTPHPAPASPFSDEQEPQPLADLVAIKRPFEKACARSDHAAETTALPNPFGTLEEKEHWATLSYGRFSSFQVLSAEEEARDEFSLGAPSPVRERHPRWKLILIGASVAALGLALGTGAGFLRRHSRKTAVAVASLSPATTPAAEHAPEQTFDQPNPAVQPQATAGSSAESPETPLQPPVSVKRDSQAGKQIPSQTTETAVLQPKIKASAAEPVPKPSFKLAPHAVAPQRASVSRETPTPPSLGEDVAASPADAAGILNGIMPGALPSDAEVPPPPPAKTPERIGGEVKPPQLLHMVPPLYPSAAKQINSQGEVTIQASIDSAGKVTDAKVISGPVLLRQAALDAVRRWKYEPATLDGKPVPMQVVVKVKFHLN